MKSKRKSRMPGEAQAVDWQSVRQRLEAVTDTINRGLAPEKAKDILRSRARTLAMEPDPGVGASEQMEILEFLLAYETYGIELSWVRETVPLKDLTSVPCTPPFVLGLINVRGRIVSVIDIRKFFDLPIKGLTDLNKVIIVHNGEMEFGILADEVIRVRSMPLSELQPSLPTLTGIRDEYLKGVTGERMVVLDGSKLLNDRNIVVREEIAD